MRRITFNLRLLNGIRKFSGIKMMTFGEFIKNMRIEKRMTLREFCRAAKFDPSNWSRRKARLSFKGLQKC